VPPEPARAETGPPHPAAPPRATRGTGSCGSASRPLSDSIAPPAGRGRLGTTCDNRDPVAAEKCLPVWPFPFARMPHRATSGGLLEASIRPVSGAHRGHKRQDRCLAVYDHPKPAEWHHCRSARLTTLSARSVRAVCQTAAKEPTFDDLRVNIVAGQRPDHRGGRGIRTPGDLRLSGFQDSG
jgi:hypothetical protein